MPPTLWLTADGVVLSINLFLVIVTGMGIVIVIARLGTQWVLNVDDNNSVALMYMCVVYTCMYIRKPRLIMRTGIKQQTAKRSICEKT